MQLKAATVFLFVLLISSANAQVYRCGNTYSNQPCKGAKEVDTSPALADPRGAQTKEIFLCRAAPGRLYWNHEHCSARGWAVERISRVPKDASWEDQVEIARSQKRNAESLASATYPTGSPSTAAPSNRAACQQLDERIKWLDSMARANSTPWITEERRLARDRQFRLHC